MHFNRRKALSYVAAIIGVFPFNSLFAGTCKEHAIMTDPVTMTASVNLDPYNRKEDTNSTLWSCSQEVYMEQSSNGNMLYEQVPEGKYLFEYNGDACSVDVVLDVYVVAVADDTTIVLPCEGESFQPQFFNVVANDYFTCRNAYRNAPVSLGDMTVEVLDAPYFVSSNGDGLVVDCPVDTAPGTFVVTYRLTDKLGRISDEMAATIHLQRNCPEKPVRPQAVERVLLEVPDYFSPNGDGVNDEWLIPGLDTLGRFQLDLFDRTGRWIWSSQEALRPWDGTSEGSPMPSQDYWYVIYLFDADTTFKGHVTLLR